MAIISFVKKSCKWIVRKLIRLHSYSPILAITNDNNFGTNEEFLFKGFKIRNGLRVSIVNIALGKFKIYLLTYLFNTQSNNKGFKL